MSDDENYDDISVNSDLDVEYLEGDESGNSKRRTKIFRKKARALNIVTGIVKSRANNERIEKTFKTLKESSIEKDEKDVDIDITEDPTHRNRKDGISLRRNSREMAEINVSISSVKTTNTILSKTESHSLPESSSRITDIRVEEQTSSAKMPQIFSDESEEEELILEERQEIREGHLIQPDNFSLDIQDETDPRQQFVNCNLSRQFTKKDKKQLKKIFKRIESQEQSSTEESDLEMGDEGHDKPEGHRKSKRSMKKSVKNASIKRTFSFKSFRNKEKADPGKEKKIKKKETVESEVSEQIIMVEDDDTENKSKKNYYNKKTVHKPIKCPNLEKIDEKEEPFSDRSLGYGKFPCVKKDNVEQELHTILRRLQDLQFKMVSSGGANGISRCRDTMEGESIRLVQYYFQKWKMKTLFQALQMYRADKQQQLVFLSQQVHLYGQELQAKLQRHNMLLDLSNIRSEAHGAHRSLLSKPQTQIPKLTLDHSLNVFFDTNYLCDPSQARKGRHDNDDWEAPFKSRSSASVTRAKNMGTQFALHNTTDHQEDERNEAEYPPQPIQSVEKPSRVMSPVMLQARSPSPDVPGSPMRVWSPALPPNVPPIERCHSKRAEVVKLSKHPVNMLQPTDAKTGLPVYNKFPVSYLNKKEPSKPPVVLSTWETRDNNGYTNQLTAESSVDVKQTGLEIDAVAEMRERSTESQKGEDMPYNFQGMLRKTKYSRESMKRNQNNSPVPRSPSPPKLIIKSSRSPTPTKSIISPRSPSPPKSIISPKLPSPPRSSTPVFYTRDSPEVDELEHSIPDVIRDNIQSSFDDSLIAETDEAML